MNQEDIAKLNAIEERFVRDVDDIRRYLEYARDSFENYIDAKAHLPYEELNELLRLGVVPGVKIILGNETYTFDGYTEYGRMLFTREKDGKSIPSDISAMLKNKDKWRIEK